jgi:intracellular sulfur oxidation DsrE/DsrF family protein
MKKPSRVRTISLFVSVCLVFVVVVTVSGEEYPALKGVQSVKTVFDIRVGNPKTAASHLKLIHQTVQDKNIAAITKNPDVIVVFLGPAVKLISKNREGFTSEDQKFLDEIATTISELSQDGIRLEVCLIAVRNSGVDPASILPEIKHVTNGWISLIGYQANGYALIASY